MNKAKSIVLLSAGLDSTVNLYLAQKNTDVQLALTFNYGQRAAEKEIAQSKKIAELLKISHRVIDLPWLQEISHSSLTNKNFKIPTGASVSIDNQILSTASAQSVWVPNRNGIFLNIAASFAEAIGAQQVIPGFNWEEAQTFPDNSEAFIKSTNNTFQFSTKNQVQVFCYTTHMNKTEIVKTAITENIPIDLLWPCYLDGVRWCGECESCQRIKRALSQNGVDSEIYFSKHFS